MHKMYFIHCLLESTIPNEKTKMMYGKEKCWQVIECTVPISVCNLHIVKGRLTLEEAENVIVELSQKPGFVEHKTKINPCMQRAGG